MKNAQNEVLDEAAEKGATHVVWHNVSGGWAPSASAMAYRCP